MSEEMENQEPTPKKKPARRRKKADEPWIKVIDINVNSDNPRNGFFELDWNDEFVNMLKQHGYTGNSDEEIVDQWFQSLCRNIGAEEGLGDIMGGYVQINRRDDGKTEVY